MPYGFKGKNVLVTGGSRGLGEIISHKFAKEGCNIAINYLSSVDQATTLAKEIKKEYGVKAILVQGDMGIEADCVRTVKETIEGLSGLDIIISNAGWTRFSTPFGDLSKILVSDWDTTFAVNVKANFFLMREAQATMSGNPDGGVFIMTSSIAAISAGGSNMTYAVSKAAQKHLMECLAATQGPKIRVNAVLPGLLLTEWGQKYDKGHIKAMEDRAWLKKVTDLEDCAQAFVDLARNTSMTGQSVVVDSGLSHG